VAASAQNPPWDLAATAPWARARCFRGADAVRPAVANVVVAVLS
jgi:hypothetical protein